MISTPLRSIAAAAVALTAMTGLGLAQGGAPPPGQPAAQAPPAGRGTDPGQRGAAPGGRGQGGGGRRGGFTQYTRPLAPPDVLARGKSLYETNCASCHAVDLRGTADGKNPNLLRSGTALADKKGELVAVAIANHEPPITLVEADAVAVAEYIHSVHATMGGQGSPPGRNPTNVVLNILVGDPASGQTFFQAACTQCHSLTGDLKGIGSKYSDPRALQNAWVAGSSGRFGGGGRGGGAGNPATVTMTDGTKLTGTLVRKDDWLVILNLPDGTRKSMPRTPGMKIEVTDPQAAHKKMVLELDDPTNKKMHDVTAYLWTIK
jgi:cytochrome c oxidase cbb3-type subunit 3